MTEPKAPMEEAVKEAVEVLTALRSATAFDPEDAQMSQVEKYLCARAQRPGGGLRQRVPLREACGCGTRVVPKARYAVSRLPASLALGLCWGQVRTGCCNSVTQLSWGPLVLR